MSVQSSWACRRQIWVLRHPRRCDLPEELDETRACMHGIASDRATEAGWLSRQLVWVVGVLFDLGLPPIEDIPRLPKIAQDALLEVALVLECLQEALDSGDDCKNHMLTYIYVCVCVFIFLLEWSGELVLL
jgi:hypothetical protein